MLEFALFVWGDRFQQGVWEGRGAVMPLMGRGQNPDGRPGEKAPRSLAHLSLEKLLL